jgi:hypothetical protein
VCWRLQLSWFKKIKFIKDISNGMAFLHRTFAYPHCFLHGRNVVISEDLNAKVSDYGVFLMDRVLASAETAAVASPRPAEPVSLADHAADLWDDDAVSPMGLTADGLAQRVAGQEKHYQALVPPEVWAGALGELDLAVDVYSYAILCTEIMSQRPAWGGVDAAAIRERVQQGERPQLGRSFPDSERTLVTRCWVQDPAERPTFAQISEGLTP